MESPKDAGLCHSQRPKKLPECVKRNLDVDQEIERDRRALAPGGLALPDKVQGDSGDGMYAYPVPSI